jgi:hypothetical protein
VILLLAVGLVIASVPLLGGQLGELRSIRIRGAAFVGAAVVVQTLLVTVLPKDVPPAVSGGAHLLTYAAGVGVLLFNRRIPGMAIVALGGLANTAAIAANNGVMPASAAARAAAGLPPLTSGGSHFANSATVSSARLGFLGDVFPWPRPMPFANVFSVGDVLLVVGIAALVWTVCGCRLRRMPALPVAG